MSDNVLVAVYGSLREGMSNWSWCLRDYEKIATGKVSNFVMFSCGGFPACVPSDEAEDKVVVEVFSVPESHMKGPMDSLEGYPQWYTRELVEVKTGEQEACEAWLYFWPDVNSGEGLPLVENGDWVEYVKDSSCYEYAC